MNNSRQAWAKRLKAIVVAFGLIAFWRGAWGIMDLYFFPNNPDLSFWASIVVGVVILLLTHHFIRELSGDE